MPFSPPSVRQEPTVMLMYACCMTGVTKAARSEEQRTHEECHPPSLLLDHCLNRHFPRAQHHPGLTPAGLAGADYSVSASKQTSILMQGHQGLWSSFGATI